MTGTPSAEVHPGLTRPDWLMPDRPPCASLASVLDGPSVLDAPSVSLSPVGQPPEDVRPADVGRGGFEVPALLLVGVAAVLDAYAWLGMFGRGSTGGLARGDLAPILTAFALFGAACALARVGQLGTTGRIVAGTAGVMVAATLTRVVLDAPSTLVAVADFAVVAAVVLALGIPCPGRHRIRRWPDPTGSR